MDFRELFALARRAARDLDRCNARIAALREKVSSPSGLSYDSIHVRSGSVNDPSRQIDAMIDREYELRTREAARCENVLDTAWEAVGVVSADLSDASAQVLSQHYLFGDTWDQVAESVNYKSRTTVKEMAWAALDWLDSYCRVTQDADGFHLRVLR